MCFFFKICVTMLYIWLSKALNITATFDEWRKIWWQVKRENSRITSFGIQSTDYEKKNEIIYATYHTPKGLQTNADIIALNLPANLPKLMMIGGLHCPLIRKCNLILQNCEQWSSQIKLCRYESWFGATLSLQMT